VIDPIRQGLNVPLHYLYYLSDFDRYDGLDDSTFDYLVHKYGHLMGDYRAAVAWAVKKPDVDYLRAAPYQGYRYSNDQVFFYLRRFHETFEDLIVRHGYILSLIYDTPYLASVDEYPLDHEPQCGLLFDPDTPAVRRPIKQPATLRHPPKRHGRTVNPTGILATLRTVMFELFYLDDAESFAGVDDSLFQRMEGIYSPEQIKRIREALSWATVCDDFEFKSLLPTLPEPNEQIGSYLFRYHHTLERRAAVHNWTSIDLNPTAIWPEPPSTTPSIDDRRN